MQQQPPLPTRPSARPTRPDTPPGKPRFSSPALRRVRGVAVRVRVIFSAAMPGPVRLLFMAATMLACVALLIAGLVSLGAGVELRAFEQHQGGSTTGDLDISMVAQSFYSPRANLSRIDLQAVSYARGDVPQGGSVRLVQGDGPDGAIVYSNTLDTVSFANNPYLQISFSPIAGSEGMTYTLVLSAPGPLRTAMGLRYNSFDALSSGRMYTDDGPERGDLVISPYYYYGAADAVGDAVDTLTGSIWPIIVWTLLLWLPGGALLLWLPGTLSGGQRVLAAPGVTLLALPLFFLVTRAVGLPFGSVAMWLLLLLCGGAIVAWVLRKGASVPSLRGVKAGDVAFWSLLGALFVATLFVRMLSLRDIEAGMGLDAYHHTLIAQMFVDQGGVPGNYAPYAPLASFTYHFGFHAMIASVAWLGGISAPADMVALMPEAGQLATALPMLLLTLLGWRLTGNRWAGLIAGALAGLMSIFPAYYVNWSRYTQGLGLALLPVAMLLFLEVVQRPLRSATPAAETASGGVGTWQTALRQSGPYLLGVIGAAGLFLTHYRIAIVYAAFVALYLLGKFVGDVRARVGLRELVAPARRSALLALLTLGAVSPWLVNLSANFRSHLVGRDSDAARAYYDLGALSGLIQHWSMWLLLGLSVVGVALAVRARRWTLLLAGLVWLPVAVWSNPYWVSGVRLPFAGYLDVNTVAQSLWLPMSLVAGYAVVEAARWLLGLAQAWKGGRERAWQMGFGALAGVALLVGGLAAALPVATNIDKKMYVTAGDEAVLAWMRANLPRDAYVLANPFAFGWAPDNVYGSDAGMWVPLLSGVGVSVPPLPAYNEKLGDPNYITNALDVIQYEPFTCVEADPLHPKCKEADWASLRRAGITHIFVGSRGGALDVPTLLASDHTQLLFHQDGAWVFGLR